MDPPVFSQGSARWGYVGRDSLESSVVIDGEVVDAWAWAGDLVLGEGRERFVFLGRTEEADFVVDDQGLERFSLVVEGTLQLLPESGRWACLVGELNARTLEVVVEDHDGTLEVSWSDFLEISPGSSAGRVGTAPVRDQLRAWVAAAARLLVGAGGAM